MIILNTFNEVNFSDKFNIFVFFGSHLSLKFYTLVCIKQKKIYVMIFNIFLRTVEYSIENVLTLNQCHLI